MRLLSRLILVFTLILLPLSLNCQINLKKKIETQTNNRANKRTDQGVNKGLDAIENGLKGAFKKKDNADQSVANQENQDVQAGDQANGNEQKAGDSNAPAQPTLETYSKYDFVPGEKVIFFEDFSQDAVGDFPALWNTNGSAEIVTTNLFDGKWMQYSGDKCVWTDNLLSLPDNYTVEFDIIPAKGEDGEGMSGYSFRLYQCINAKAWDGGSVPGKAGFALYVEYFGRPGYRTYINSNEGSQLGLTGTKEGDSFKQKLNQKYHMAIWVQKSRVRLYQGESKLFDLPKAFPLPSVKMDRIRFESGSAMVSNIRIAVGTPDTRSKLLTEGKLITYGIYFDVNKDVVKPESYGTLKDIATVLNENQGIKVKIVGFTDSDGDDASNLDLSKRRAASVRNELVNGFAVDGSRLETDGSGEGQPVAPNDTPSNKALNRRVEFIKL